MSVNFRPSSRLVDKTLRDRLSNSVLTSKLHKRRSIALDFQSELLACFMTLQYHEFVELIMQGLGNSAVSHAESGQLRRYRKPCEEFN